MRYNLSHIRREYAQRSLSKNDVDKNPFRQLERWLDEAVHAEAYEPTAMILSTSDAKGRVTSRTVLLKEMKTEGLVFYTNCNSLKGRQLKENPFVSALFYWAELESQVRLEGVTEKVPPEESDRYFESRPETSRIGTWASDQSTEIPDRKYLEQRQQEYSEYFRNKKIERPPHWGGYLIRPTRFEFWQGRENRLHDRIEYSLEEKKWVLRRLAP
ncbi:MAG: pyridoxamine 5'-phosphate oxidase [Bacteroidales bacterium]